MIDARYLNKHVMKEMIIKDITYDDQKSFILQDF